MPKGRVSPQVAAEGWALDPSISAVGRWMESHGAAVEFGIALGSWTVTVAWCELVSYSDAHGQYRKEWRVTRHGPDLGEAFKSAIEEALSQTVSAAKVQS